MPLAVKGINGQRGHRVGRKSRRFLAGAFRRMHPALAEGASAFPPVFYAKKRTRYFFVRHVEA
jgi:hypothetical protein